MIHRRTMRNGYKWIAGLCLLCVGVNGSTSCASEASEPATPPLQPIEIGSPAQIRVEPERIDLGSSRSRGRLVVTGIYAEQQLQDLTRVATVRSGDEQIVRIERETIVPVGDGATELIVEVGGHQAKIPVHVTGHGSADPISFHHETLAALTKQGCNSGGCHGSPSGKGGFRLSLEAYDSALDASTLVRESLGRRTNRLAAEQSLLLLKPTMQVSHGGGRRLDRADVTYEVLRTWIAEGCRIDQGEADASACVRLEVLPRSGRVLKWPAHTQQLVARAHFADGSIRDVTSLVKLTSSDTSVARVSPEGLVIGVARGEAAIMVRYLQHLESVLFTFVHDVEGFAWTDPPENNYVDTLVHAKLKQLKYVPATLCADEEFVRRVYLDVIGIPPTTEEALQFLDDRLPDKRQRLIDRLLDRPEYARFWALRWGDLLRIKEKNVTAEGVRKFYAWIVGAFERNMPIDQFARQLITSQGSTFINSPSNYYRTLTDPTVCTESTAQLFLGVRIQCAKCHNHPFERWTQDNYYGMSAFFQRVRQKEGSRPGEQIVWVARSGEATQPRTGQQMKPWLPAAGTIDDEGSRDRREILADWLTDPHNPFFAKVIVNRLWAHLLGRGIVEPVDDFRDSNPPANAELLNTLAQELRESGFDQKRVLKTILNSRTYQLSAQTNDLNKGDTRYFSHFRVRMLTAEQLLDAICHLTDVPESFAGLPAGTRATQLPSPDQNHEFLKLFGQPDRETSCACERSSESNLTQALQLFNGSLVHTKLQNPQNRFRRALASGATDDVIVTDMYLAAFARRPTAEEVAAAKSYIGANSDRAAAHEDLCWSLINTNEFLFQH